MSLLSILLSLALSSSLTASTEQALHGMPFGKVTDEDVDRLAEFAKARNCDLVKDLDLALGRDEAALARVFTFSREFTSFDPNARVYAQVIYNSLLNVGEVIGVEKYAQVLAQQPADVQQRVRDILYHPVATAPFEQRTPAKIAVLLMYPSLFPGSYSYAKNNPFFTPRSWSYWAHPARWTELIE